jgi:hypothetical protein
MSVALVVSKNRNFQTNDFVKGRVEVVVGVVKEIALGDGRGGSSQLCLMNLAAPLFSSLPDAAML